MDIFQAHWEDVENDLVEYYGIDDPLGLGWRELKVRTTGLPAESRVMFRIRETKEFGGSPDAPDWLVELNKIRGVRPNRVERR